MASTRRKIVVRCMAVATVAVLAVVGWLWAQWPVRTAEEFILRAKANDYLACHAMLADPVKENMEDTRYVVDKESGELAIEQRSPSDIIFGRAEISTDRMSIPVQRGDITLPSQDFMNALRESDKRSRETLNLLRDAPEWQKGSISFGPVD